MGALPGKQSGVRPHPGYDAPAYPPTQYQGGQGRGPRGQRVGVGVGSPTCGVPPYGGMVPAAVPPHRLCTCMVPPPGPTFATHHTAWHSPPYSCRSPRTVRPPTVPNSYGTRNCTVPGPARRTSAVSWPVCTLSVRETSKPNGATNCRV